MHRFRPCARRSARGAAPREEGAAGRAQARSPPSRAAKPAREAEAPAAPRELEQRHLDLIGLGLIAARPLPGLRPLRRLGRRLGRLRPEDRPDLGRRRRRLRAADAARRRRPGARRPAADPLPGRAQRRRAAARRRPAARVRRRDRRPRPRPPGSRRALRPRLLHRRTAARSARRLYWASTTLFQRIGAHIIALLLILSGDPAAQRPAARRPDRLRRRGRAPRRRARPGASPGPPGTPRRARTNGPGDGWTTTIYEDAERRALRPDATRTRSTSAPTTLPTRRPRRPADRRGAASTDALEDDGDGGRAGRADPVPDGDEAEIEISRTPMGAKRGGITESDEIDYRMPPPKLLRRGGDDKDRGPDRRDMEKTARALLEVLSHFKIEARLIGTVTGPHVSRYELQLAPGHEGRQDRPAQGRPRLRARLDRHPHPRADPGQEGGRRRGPERAPQDGPPRRHLRRPPAGRLAAARLARQGHLRPGGLDGPGEDAARPVAGTTGSGKSGSVNAILTSMLLHASPNELRLVLVDPKQVELNHYDSTPHLLTPVVTSPRVAANVLENLVAEMESRYTVMGKARGPQPRGAEQDPRQGRRGAAAAHPLRDRRARRPDDGRPGRGRGLDHPPGAEVARGRHPPAARHPAALDGRDHRHDQGQHPGPDRLRGRLADRLARDPRPGRRGVAARAWATCSSARSAPRSCSASRAPS